MGGWYAVMKCFHLVTAHYLHEHVCVMTKTLKSVFNLWGFKLLSALFKRLPSKSHQMIELCLCRRLLPFSSHPLQSCQCSLSSFCHPSFLLTCPLPLSHIDSWLNVALWSDDWPTFPVLAKTASAKNLICPGNTNVHMHKYRVRCKSAQTHDYNLLHSVPDVLFIFPSSE